MLPLVLVASANASGSRASVKGPLSLGLLGLRGSKARKGGLPSGFQQRLQDALGISHPTRQVHSTLGLSLRCTPSSGEEEAT